MDHRRSSSYSYGTTTRDSATHHTSSAFSASAQPNEDWTKISDLAERRRIQNRIAQRNYRKKLKKRLEDLERKAASTSPSPELKSAELPLTTTKSRSKSNSPKRRHSSEQHLSPQPLTAPISSSNTPSIADDWTMFSNQHTQQLPASPPSFSFPLLDHTQAPPSPSLPAGSFSAYGGSSMDGAFSFQPYLQPLDPTIQMSYQDKSMPIKSESMFEPTLSPMHVPEYMSVPIMDMSFPASFSDSSLTPELCDLYEQSSAGSPGELNTFPQTPMMMPLSPPFLSFDL